MTAKEFQNDPITQYALRVAKVESGNNPNAKNPYSTAGGLFQFTQSTFKGISDKYNLGYNAEDRYDPTKARKVFELFTKENEKQLKKVVGNNVTDADRYLAHFLGGDGASKLLKAYQSNPNTPVSQIVSQGALNANKGVLTDKQGIPKTVGEVYGWAGNKIGVEVSQNNTPIITDDFTELPIPVPKANFTPLKYSLPEGQDKPTETDKAKEQIVQKNNEDLFIQDFINSRQPVEIQNQVIPEQIQPKQTDIFGDYAQISSFVENPTMQEGGETEWLQNWYANRQIPNERVQNLYQRDKEGFTILADFIPAPIQVDSLPDNAVGQYDPNSGQIFMTPEAKSSTYLHEATHKTQDFNSAMRTFHETLVNKNIKNQDDLKNEYNSDYNYYKDPDEIHARIQVLRNQAGIQPNQTVTPEYLQNFLKTYKGGDTNIDDLINLTDEKGLLQLLNYMASNNSTNNTYAQQGGFIPISSRGMYEYPNQKVIVPTNGSITMKNIPHNILAKSIETGEEKILNPGLEYFFSRTKHVLEIPIK